MSATMDLIVDGSVCDWVVDEFLGRAFDPDE
jgi:hypothetical protein